MVQQQNIEKNLSTWRRHLHQFPELSGEEFESASYIHDVLVKMGLAPTIHLGGRGVVVDIQGVDPSRNVAFRADTDALPILERSEEKFSSKSEGVMHACGHDAHTATLLGLALKLSEKAPAVNCRLIFQPAEETIEGANEVIEEGLLNGIDSIFGLHYYPDYPVGEIIVKEGIIMASSDNFDIEVVGKASHAAKPEDGKDAILCAVRIIEGIQGIISREIAASDVGIVSIGMLQAGKARNVVAGSAALSGTIRAHTSQIREKLKSRVQGIAKNVGDSMEMEVTINFVSSCPPLINSAEMVEFCTRLAARTEGVSKVSDTERASLGSEDFSCYLDHLPGCFVKIGSRVPDYPYYPLHSDRYRLNEKAMLIGVGYFEQIARSTNSVSLQEVDSSFISCSCL